MLEFWQNIILFLIYVPVSNEDIWKWSYVLFFLVPDAFLLSFCDFFILVLTSRWGYMLNYAPHPAWSAVCQCVCAQELCASHVLKCIWRNLWEWRSRYWEALLLRCPRLLPPAAIQRASILEMKCLHHIRMLFLLTHPCSCKHVDQVEYGVEIYLTVCVLAVFQLERKANGCCFFSFSLSHS